MSLRERIGVDTDTKLEPLEAVKWAAENDVHYLDICLDDTNLDPKTYDEEHSAEIRTICEENDVHFGLHTLSSVNVAETSPVAGEGIDEYLKAYIDIAERTGAEWIIVHGGYHQSDDIDARIETAIDRLKRAAEYAEGTGTTLFLENHNKEPDAAEMKYIPATLEQTKRYFENLPEEIRWAFNPPHAHLQPEGVSGFIDEMDLGRCGEVRLNDNRGEKEEHLPLGEGTIDFEMLVDRLENEIGYEGHYSLAYGSLDDMLEGREYLLDLVGEA